MGRKMIDFSKLSIQELKDFKDRYDAYIFDMDGCLVNLAGVPIEGVSEALDEISKHGKSIYSVTDNCMVTLKDFAARISGFFPVIKKGVSEALDEISKHGKSIYSVTDKCAVALKDFAARINGIFPAIKKENAMTVGHLVVRYLKEINFNKKIYVIGTEGGVIRELKEHGFQILYDEGKTPKVSLADLKKVKLEDGVGAVLVAFDFYFNYLKMFKAVNYLANPEVLLLQTNIMAVALTNPVFPAVGTTISGVMISSGRTESIATGKGSEYCSKYLKSLGFPMERCLFIGDGLESDIYAGNRSGMDTLLVLSGSGSLKEVEDAKTNNKNVLYIPTYYTNSVADLMNAFKTE